MARGRKAKLTNENKLQILNDKLMQKQCELYNNLNIVDAIRNEIKEIEEDIRQEEIKQLTSLMHEKQITFDEVKTLLENHNPAKQSTEEEVIVQ